MKRAKIQVPFIAVLTACVLLFAFSVMSAPIIVRINDVPNAAPVVTIIGAPNGYDIDTGPDVATPGVEDGGLITIFGVQDSLIPEEGKGWRFLDSRDPSTLPPLYGSDYPEDPTNYREFVLAVDIVWIQHDTDGPFFEGDLQVGFNSAMPGHWYVNPELRGDENAGYVTDKYVTVYADETVIVQFKPHTYITKQK
jgi:hypothetical protein